MSVSLQPSLKKFISDFGSEKIFNLISALSIIIIFTVDMGVPLNALEKKIYNNPFFISFGVFSTAYVTLGDVNDAIFLFILWYVIKYVLNKKEQIEQNKENNN